MAKIEVVLLLLPALFAFATASEASTPLVSCTCQGDEESAYNLTLAKRTKGLIVEITRLQ